MEHGIDRYAEQDPPSLATSPGDQVPPASIKTQRPSLSAQHGDPMEIPHTPTVNLTGDPAPGTTTTNTTTSGFSPAAAQEQSPSRSQTALSPDAHTVSAGRRSPMHISHSVSANVVRNAQPPEMQSPIGTPGLSADFSAGYYGGVGPGVDPATTMSFTGAGAPTGQSTESVPGFAASIDLHHAREEALQRFAKVRNFVRDKMHKAKEQRTHSEGGGGGGDASCSSRRGSDNVVTIHSPDDDDLGSGDRFLQVLRAMMHEANQIDRKEVESPDAEGAFEDWGNEGDNVMGGSAFFSSANVEATSNRVMEAIINRGHAAATDDELRWLYRHTNLLNLLDEDDLRRAVSISLRREYSKGETIAHHDCAMQHLYVVLWGDVEVFMPTSLDTEKKALETAFRVTATQQNLHRRSAEIRGSANPNDLLEITTQQQQRSNSLGSVGTRLIGRRGTMESTNSEDDDDVIFTHVATLLPGQLFGTESFVFDQNNAFQFRAGGSTKKTVVALIPFDGIRPALATCPRFAQGVGGAIAGSVDVFGAIRQFCRYVFSSQTSQNEYLPLWSILDSYTKINNVIHTKLFSTELDTGAWGYALNRLPENVTSTFCFDLVHALPPFVASRMRVEAHAADVSKVRQDAFDAPRARTSVAYIRTRERRRCTWHLGMEGKDLVLLRDGFTDLLDFLTMLCVHIIESNKLRGRVQGMVHPPAIDILDDYLRTREEEHAQQVKVSKGAEMARIKDVLAHMPLTTEEQEGLLRNWGNQTLVKIYEVMMHREEFNVRVDPSISRKFQTNPFHEWALNLRGCVLEKLGLDRSSPLPDDVRIDVVSSNTHCIKNLLCSFNRRYRNEILEYATQKEGKRLGNPEEWHNIEDMIYIATSGFLRDERPDLKDEFLKSLEDNGITVLHDTAMTGLQVDVIPVHMLDFATIDETIRDSLCQRHNSAARQHASDSGPLAAQQIPSWEEVCKPIVNARQQQKAYHRRRSTHLNLVPGNGTSSADGSTYASPVSVRSSMATAGGGATPPPPASQQQSPPEGDPPRGGRLRRHFIINMDFAFGAQAEGICRAVFSAFGTHIRSVSVMGKAGGMQGKRGDIQLASHVLLSKSSLILEDNQDELRNCRNQDLTKERLSELAGPRVDVHHGKVLTVTGTMLQNVPLLRYYKNVWRCVGTEMEGSYFARVIEDFYRQGIAQPDLTTRFAYYTSDLPLAMSDAEDAMRAGKKHSGDAATLSAPMTPQEGVPPLYAIARGILENILLS